MSMRWILGVDVRPSTAGALKFAHWLAHRSEPTPAVIPVHVLEESYLRVVQPYHSLDDLMARAADSVRQVLGAAGLVHLEPRVVPGPSAEEVLERMAHDEQATGIIVGRQAPRGRQPLVRLGRVARRLVRRAPRPIVVVPPDLEPEQHSDGPVLLATDLDDGTTSAATMARQLAVTLGRELEVAHVVPMAEDFGAHYIPSESLERFRVAETNRGRRELEAWLAAQDLQDSKRRVLQGSVIENLVELARHEQTPLLVCGSRRLKLVDRLTQGSVAVELSAASHCPVMVVPPALAGEGPA